MKRSLAFLAVFPMGLVASLVSSVALAQPAPPVAGRWYRLQTVFRGAGECLEGNQSASPVHGGAAFMDRCQNVSGQLWSFEPVAGGFYRLRTQFQGQQMCLEGNQSASPVHGGAAFMDRCQNVSGQLWRLVPEGNGFRLRTQFRGDGECLEGNQSASPVHGGSAFMDSCQNVSGQVWNIVPAGGRPAAAPTPPPAPASVERPDHRCGPAFGNGRCDTGRCCSVHAWCGGQQEPHCGAERGFNGQFDGR
ncbi:MAG: RICIN domain-containing protein [Myxococcales bacterium]|nr:RICIN domain-containing protein [Myxococcales bacterium]